MSVVNNMKIFVNGKIVGTKELGCAICGSTWGSYYEVVEGEKLFFCCDICAKEFVNMLSEAKTRTGWDKVEEVDIKGNFQTGRTVTITNKGNKYRFYVKFDDDGNIQTFKEL
jgi:hypothetical protein